MLYPNDNDKLNNIVFTNDLILNRKLKYYCNLVCDTKMI